MDKGSNEINNKKPEKKIVKKSIKKNAMFKLLIAVGVAVVLILGIAIAYVIHLYSLMDYDDGNNPSSSYAPEDVAMKRLRIRMI